MKKNKSLVVIASLVLLSAGGYALYRWYQGKKSTDAGSESGTNEPTGSTDKTPSPSTTEDSPSDVLAFQKYANGQGWSPKLVEDGIFGSKTKAAWASLSSSFKNQKNYTSAIDALSADIKALDLKKIYAKAPVKVYNLSNKVSFTAKGGELLGTVSNSRKSGNGYVVYFFRNGVKYYTVNINNIGF